jgi:uncharacterized membrane protein YgdD (TMEM256/DUF423 family)
VTRARFMRVLAAIAGLMGAGGIVLAALSAHQPDATRLASASSMLLFHAAAILAVLASCGHHLLRGGIGLAAACALALGAMLFTLDLTLRQFAGHSLFPMAAPTGGTILILAWLVLAVAAIGAVARN